MKFLDQEIQLRGPVSIGDLKKIVELSDLISNASQEWEVVLYQNEIIKILTNLKEPEERHREKLREIMIESGFEKQAEPQDKENMLETLDAAINVMSAKIFISPKQIEDGFNMKNFISVAQEIEKNELLYYMNMVQVQHGQADEFFDELKNRLNEIKSKTRKEIIMEENRNNDDNVIYIDSAFKKARQPI